MKKIAKFFSDNPRYRRYKKPLEAAEICDRARELSQGQYDVVSFNRGLLTLGCSSSAQAANLQAEATRIIEDINQKIGREAVKRIRLKISN